MPMRYDKKIIFIMQNAKLTNNIDYFLEIFLYSALIYIYLKTNQNI